MPRADLLLALVRASARADSSSFRQSLEAIIAEERVKQHKRALIARYAESCDVTGAVHAEDGKIAVRHARTHGRDGLKKLSGVSEDDVKHAEKELQKYTDEHVHQVDELLKHKEAEILEV